MYVLYMSMNGVFPDIWHFIDFSSNNTKRTHDNNITCPGPCSSHNQPVYLTSTESPCSRASPSPRPRSWMINVSSDPTTLLALVIAICNRDR